MSFSAQQLEKRTNGAYNKFFKRLIDLLVSVPLFICLLPVYFFVAIAIVIDSGFPVFYCGVRGGYKNHSFKIMKFRSMVNDAEKLGGPTTALHDVRITNVGHFLRKTKLDEFPQLINIIKGEMSFVGPRPEVLKYVNMFEGLEKYILEVRPGITDFSSLKFDDMDAVVGDGDVDAFFVSNILPKKNELRLKYVSELSFLTDMKIFFQTVVHVLRHFSKSDR